MTLELLYCGLVNQYFWGVSILLKCAIYTQSAPTKIHLKWLIINMYAKNCIVSDVGQLLLMDMSCDERPMSDMTIHVWNSLDSLASFTYLHTTGGHCGQLDQSKARSSLKLDVVIQILKNVPSLPAWVQMDAHTAGTWFTIITENLDRHCRHRQTGRQRKRERRTRHRFCTENHVFSHSQPSWGVQRPAVWIMSCLSSKLPP